MCALRSAGIAFGSFRLSVTNQRVECRHAVSTWRRKWRSPALGGHFVRQIRRTVADSLLLHLSLTQLQFLLIQRIKRSLRIFELYCTLYERDALRALARSYGRRLADRARWSLLGVPLVTNSNNNSNNTSTNKNDNSGGDRSQHDGGYEQSSWKESSSNVSGTAAAAAAAAGADKNGQSGGDSRNNQASSSVSHGYENEFDEFGELLLNSVYCSECHCRQLIDQKVSGVDYCRCNNGEPTAAVNRLPASSWVPFLEKRGTIVWRRQHEQHRHLYVYKVYGSFSDISADAFCEVQLNTEFRRVWDNSVEQLRVIDPPTEVNDLKVTDPKANDSKINDHNVIGTKVNDPEVRAGSSSSSHALSGVAVIYWLVRFPRMFSNRDYVFERRHYRDDVTTTSSSSVRGESGASPGQLTIVSRAVADDWADLYCPRPAGVVRVSDYWSVMVVRPHTTFDKPGMDYGLTYFDDPGTQLPTFVTSYVTASGLPDFLERVAEAARKIQLQLSTDSLSIKPQYLPYRSLSDNVSPHSAAFSSSTSSSCYSASSNSSPLSSSNSFPLSSSSNSSPLSSSSNSSPLSSSTSSPSSDNSSNSNNSTGVTESPKLSARGRISAIS